MTEETAVDELKSIIPKLFISYSWTNDQHVDWVMQLATDLRKHGVDAIIDQWFLKEGQDAHSFMEQMVRDEGVTKVVLICDEKYVSRANERKGGVGVESQIITKKIYGDVNQTKFVAVALASEENGDALLPNFLANRIYVDFRNEDEYARNLTQLLRWTFDKPLHALPKIGERPAFLDEQTSFQPVSLSSVSISRQSGRSQEVSFLPFWREAREKHSDFTLELAKAENADELVFEAIGALAPLISQMIVSVRDRTEHSELNDVEIDALLSFFEQVLSNHSKGSTSWSGDVTKFLGEFVFVSFVAIILRNRRFASLTTLLKTPIITMEFDGVTARTISLTRLNTRLGSLEYRKQRLKLNRVSLHADMIRDMSNLVPIDFWEYLQADFYLFLFFDRQDRNDRWWPDSNIFAADRDGAYPIFARATSPQLRDELLSPLGLASLEKMEQLENEIREGRYHQIRWNTAFSNLSIWSLGNFAAILETYRS